MPPISTATLIHNEGRKLIKMYHALEFRKDSGQWDAQLQELRKISETLWGLSEKVYTMSNVAGRQKDTVAQMLDTQSLMEDIAHKLEEILGDHEPSEDWTSRERVCTRLYSMGLRLKSCRLTADPTRPSKGHISAGMKHPADSKLNKVVAQPDPTDQLD